MAARYTWMFRTAAALFLFFGGVWLWRFGLTDYHPEQRPYGLAAARCPCSSACFCCDGHRLAIGVSAAATAVVGISAAVFAPSARGPAILFLAGLAIVCCLYAVFAARALREPADRGGE